MKLLLDTHVLLWTLDDPGQLRAATLAALENPENELYLSAVSAWEMAIKQSLGKLVLPDAIESWLPGALEEAGIEPLPVTLEDALRVRALPWHHRDPFDRLLVAQAQRGLVLVTRDERLKDYGVRILRA